MGDAERVRAQGLAAGGLLAVEARAVPGAPAANLKAVKARPLPAWASVEATVEAPPVSAWAGIAPASAAERADAEHAPRSARRNPVRVFLAAFISLRRLRG